MSAFLSFSSTEIYMALVLLPEMMTTYLASPFLRILSITRSLVELRSIDQFRYIKIQRKTKDLRTRLWGINTEFVGFIPQSLVLRSIVLG